MENVLPLRMYRYNSSPPLLQRAMLWSVMSLLERRLIVRGNIKCRKWYCKDMYPCPWRGGGRQCPWHSDHSVPDICMYFMWGSNTTLVLSGMYLYWCHLPVRCYPHLPEERLRCPGSDEILLPGWSNRIWLKTKHVTWYGENLIFFSAIVT